MASEEAKGDAGLPPLPARSARCRIVSSALGRQSAVALGAIVLISLAVGALLATSSVGESAVGDGTGRNQIVLYYANETTVQAARSDNYAALLSILRMSANPLAPEIMNALVEDAKEYPAAVQHDIDQLLTVARRRAFDLAIFSNTLALDRQYLFYRAAAGVVEIGQLPELPGAPSPALATAPLSRPEYFDAALREVGARYPPDSLDVILITNSHGAGDLALTPRVFADLTNVNVPALWAELDRPAAGAGERAVWAAFPGTTKRDYWNVLNEVSRWRGLRFPLVFRQACESGPSSWAEIGAVPSSVDAVAHTADAMLGFSDVDDAAALDTDATGAVRVRQLSVALEKSGIEVDRRPMLWLPLARSALARNYPFLFFLPLAAWLAWQCRTLIGSFRRPYRIV
jgi:hypothetical protein